MAYNEELAQRIRQHMQSIEHITEKKMFGGLTFLYKKKMTVGIVKDQLVVRIVSEKFQDILKLEHVADMDFTKRPLKDFVYVNLPAFETEPQLAEWIELGIEHAIRQTS
jgi:TfoX/Sxy family transcriptional regulator of competence genes